MYLLLLSGVSRVTSCCLMASQTCRYVSVRSNMNPPRVNNLRYALEESSCINRFLCGQNRPWKLSVSQGAVAGGVLVIDIDIDIYNSPRNSAMLQKVSCLSVCLTAYRSLCLSRWQLAQYERPLKCPMVQGKCCSFQVRERL